MRAGASLAAYGSAGTRTAHERPYRLVLGVSISLALHAALLLAHRQHWQAPVADSGMEPVRSIAVWLRAPEPVAVVERVPHSQEETKKPREPRSSATVTPSRDANRSARRVASDQARPVDAMDRVDVIATPDQSPGHAEPPDVFSVAPNASTRGGESKFDHGAALRLAREMADDPDPARAGTAVGQIPPKPLATETKLTRAIAGAKRRDCKDGIPGGLLAPLILLMDKKDSGCKW